MAVQFRNALATWLQAELSHTLLYNYPSIAELVEHLTTHLGPDAPPPEPTTAILEQSSEQDLDDLSEDDLFRCSNSKLTQHDRIDFTRQ